MTALLETTYNWSIKTDNDLLMVYIDSKRLLTLLTLTDAILFRKLANYGLDLGSLRFFVSYLGNRSPRNVKLMAYCPVQAN